jgi:hypothetical protein
MELAGDVGNDKTYFVLQISFPRSFKVTKVRKNRRMTIKNMEKLQFFSVIWI